MRGGYIIIDFKGVALTSGQAATVPGSYAAAENPYKKATLVSGLTVGDTEYPDFYATFAEGENGYSAAATVSGDSITIAVAEGDSVTVTVA